MEDKGVERRLIAILAADVVGYSRLMEIDEEGTHNRLKKLRKEFVEPVIAGYRGRIIKLTGDGALVEFPSAVDAVRCAVDIQRGMAAQNTDESPSQSIVFRIGINIGDIIDDENDIYGGGVNVAARLESLADPGGILVSGTAYDQVEGRLEFGLQFIGEKEVKNIERPVRVYRVAADQRPNDSSQSIQSTVDSRLTRRSILAAVLVLGGVLTLVGFNREILQIFSGSQQAMDPASDIPSIIVLPFLNLSDEENQDYFVDGISEDLIIDLSKLSDLFVISRNTAFSYKDRSVSVSKLASELGVQYVLEGSVRRAGDRIRVSAQLIDAQGDRHLWADRYDRELTDVFAVQDDVKQEIVNALAVNLSIGEQNSLVDRSTEDLDAYEFYLRARQAMRQGDARSLRLAYWAFEKTIKIDPGFAEAYAGLALTYALDYSGTLSWGDWTRPPARALSSAEALANKALELGPNLSLAEVALATLRLSELRYEDALVHAERAVSMEPSNSETYAIQARALTAVGDHDKALATIQEAFRRNPQAPADHYETLGIVQFALRDYSAAQVNLERALELMTVSGHWLTVAFLAATYGHQGKSALASFQRYKPSVSEVRLFPPYRRVEDQAHLIEGVRRAEMPEYAFDIVPSEHVERRLGDDELKQLLFGHLFTAICRRTRLEATLKFATNGTTTWQMRHDISDTSESRIQDNELCVTFPTITRGREACFMVFENDQINRAGTGHEYLLVGPHSCYFSRIE